MSVTTSKILKFELFALFLLTVSSFVAFYYSEALPDNFLSISSTAEDVSFLGYYTVSIISFVGHYTGPWIFFSFILFTLFYSFQFSKRDKVFDAFNVFSLMASCLLFSYLFFPEFVGGGIRFLLQKTIPNNWVIFFAISLLVGFLAGSFRGSFKDALINFAYFIRELPHKMKISFERVQPKRVVLQASEKTQKIKSFFQVDLPSVLKGDRQPERSEQQVQDGYQAYPQENFAEERSVEEVTTQKVDSPVTDKELPKPYKKSSTEKVEEKIYYDIVQTIAHKKTALNKNHPDNGYFEDIIFRIEQKLQDFGIKGQIINVLKGPVVDTFELELGAGVKVSKVTNAEKDLSMALLGAPIRIVYPMIGRTTVGIEVPRNPREIIYLDEVLSSKEFTNSKMTLPIAMGKDAFGETFVVDLANMPHMLVAGATGAGKSVFINSLLVSLLVKKSPNQMKLILIDPKQLELALYSSLPHLIMPVVTQPKIASIALLWATEEMERRYSILKEFGVRNLEGFNNKLETATPHMLAKIHQYYENADQDGYALPSLVIIVDEFADLILTKAGKEIENNICRLAAKARAAGIHLVLATQRPSVDVITGLIKSNFPTRVSFRVTSSVDSRTILNTTGAEKLLGKGDMLYKHGTTSSRVHSSYVEEDEIEALTNKLAEMPQTYHEGAMDFLENGGEVEKDDYTFGTHIPSSTSGGSSKDDLYSEAVKVVVEHRSASASMLQRRLKIGYNRAANLVEEMESQGVVGPAEGSKRRKVLMGSSDL